VGTQVSEGGLPWRYAPDGSVLVASPAKETRVYGDQEYVLEESIRADVGLVRAAVGDRHGNLVFHESARNFNPLCAMAGALTIAEVETLVEPGEILPESVHTPGVFVQRVVGPVGTQDKRIERHTVRRRDAPGGAAPSAAGSEGGG
jgi:3-oxoacid CoA-transferase subunit A